MNRDKKTKNELLYNFQMKVKELFNEINKILSGKKGSRVPKLMDRYVGNPQKNKPLELLET